MNTGVVARLRREARQVWAGWRHVLRGEDEAARRAFPAGWGAFWRSLAAMAAGMALDTLFGVLVGGEIPETKDLAIVAGIAVAFYGALAAPALLWWRWRHVVAMLSAWNWLQVFLLPLSLAITLLDAVVQRSAGLLARGTGMADVPVMVLVVAMMAVAMWMVLRLASAMLGLGMGRVALVVVSVLAGYVALAVGVLDAQVPGEEVPLWLVMGFWFVFALVGIGGLVLAGWLLGWPLRRLARRERGERMAP